MKIIAPTFLAAIKNWVRYFVLPITVFIISNVSAFAEDLPPVSAPVPSQIISLNSALDDYKQLAVNGGWEKFSVGKAIKIGASDARIPTARQILATMGDYTGEQDLSSNVLDKNLSEAVKHFQERHGLEQDGAIGKKTQLALAVPVEARIAQMETSLEQMREMPDLGNRYILVNVAGFYLKAVADNKTALTSRIIVGKPVHATPLFSRAITDVSFNPQWHVPESIVKNEFMGKLRKNPEFFNKGNFTITDPDGEKVDASNIDWENHGGSNFRFTQRSGSSNALGKLKFNLPDTDNIYLHSTGSPKLFAKAERALSHGCIRVEKILELAYFVMNGMVDWNESKIAKMYEGNTSKIVSVKPVQVYLAYWTSWVDEDSKQPNFYPDVYGHDKKRMAQLLQDNNDNHGKVSGEMKLAME